MNQSRLPKWFGYVAPAAALAPVVVGIWPMQGAWFFVVGGAICFCAPVVGLWWGESRGKSEGTRAALGCFTTLALFVVYLLWAVFFARLIFDR